MFNDYDKDLLRTGILNAKNGDKESARRYLDRAIYISNDHEVLAEAWFWMSQVTDDVVEKRKALENCLTQDIHHTRARRALAILNGQLRPDEIVAPDRLPPVPENLHAVNAERFMCPKCGGRMSFAPDGQSLVCEYCSRNQKFALSGAAREKDFLITMATARAHSQPLKQQVFHCEGCGCRFILPPNQISSTCAYCGSPYVVNWESEEELLAPDGIIPHAFTQKRAIQILIEWVKTNKVKPEKQVERPRGIYLPLWTFDLGGTIERVYEGMDPSAFHIESVVDNRQYIHSQPENFRVSDAYPVQINDLPIPASRKLSGVFLKMIPTFDLKAIQPYDPRYLVNWPAEVYDIPMAEASLDARARTLAFYKRDLPDSRTGMRLVTTSSANMTVESFRLDLLPIWMTEIPFGGRTHLLLINGQNGVVASDSFERSSGGLMEFLSDLLE